MEKFKLALSAGHGLKTAGKRCMKALDQNETREWTLNNRVADKIESLLVDYDGIDILRVDDTTGAIDVALATRTTNANKFGADFYLSIHHNAGANGSSSGGIVAYVYTNPSSDSVDWQNKLYNELIAQTGLKGNRSDGTLCANFHEVRETNMPAVLLELGFMDSKVDVPIILSDDFANKCAQACVNVIVKKAGLKKKQTVQSITTTAKGKEYKIVKVINRYASASDAKEKINAKGTYEIGTYYIYNKYPDGLSGMYNISKDVTGASAGSWINPSENVIGQTQTQNKAVYDLDYPIKTKIIDKSVSRTDSDCVKAIKYILTNNSDFDVSIAKAFFELSKKYGIDPAMAISQSILETGWFKYSGSAVKPEQHNYCGLGVTSNGLTGGSFETIEDGVTAQLQHLYAYGCKDALPDDEEILDPRFKYVTRGIAPYWQQLAGRWAVAGYDTKTYATPEEAMKAENTYGQKILNISNKLLATTVTNEDVEKYFKVNNEQTESKSENKPEVPDVSTTPVQPDNNNEPEDNADKELKENANFVFDFLAKLIKTLITFFKNFGGNNNE